MKVIAETHGDRSVGIMPTRFELDVGNGGFDKEERAFLKELLLALTLEFVDERSGSSWCDDECPDCFQEMEDGQCVNIHCISNMPEEA